MAVKDNLQKCELDLTNAEGILQSTESNSSERTKPDCSSQHAAITICWLLLSHFISPESQSHTCTSYCD